MLALGGCSPGRPRAPVRGRVLLDGQPLRFGSVTFQPEGGQPASGVIQADGTFVLDTPGAGRGATVGRNQVRVACYEAQDPAAKPGQFGEGLGRLLIPARYSSYDTSELVITVPAGGLEDVLIELRSQ